MNSVIGLSHLVFTIDSEVDIAAAGSVFLQQFYALGEDFYFDHRSVRLNLIRDKQNEQSQLTLYKSRFNDMPAIELLRVKSSIKRPRETYGFIQAGITPLAEQELKKYYFPGTDFFVDYYNDDVLGSRIACATNFFEKGYGCWITVDDFDLQKAFFSSIKSARIFVDTDDIFIVGCKVINKRFSNFTFVLIKNRKQTIFYNDDCGISTLGWFAKEIEKHHTIGFAETIPFSISLNGNLFGAKFLYNNRSISHELLKLN